MAWPLIPIAISGLSGALGTSLFKDWISKKDATTQGITYSPSSQDVYHSPYENYAPQMQYAPQIGYSYVGSTYQINSPNATSKKLSTLGQESEPRQEGVWELPQTYSFTPDYSTRDKSTNLTDVAIIAALGIVAYGLVSNRGKKK